MSSPKEQQNHGLMVGGAMSRTHLYRKVMKPLLERKRRARINRCLEDLRNLLKVMTHMDDEALAKMDKADILELTVHLLHRQRCPEATPPQATFAPQNQQLAMERYWCGFRQCAFEVSQRVQRTDCQLNADFLEKLEHLVPSKPPLWRPW
ncbi:enhancer of split mdelta protein [Drosophila elegans]|uniref:enhancer of split mdelta protein n=1 Tax=Drosophila elegans TaxID=30023 RepID=UPI0007E7B0C0|nr:enhancer of split mdelta protein [Drosophila elegans]